MKDLKVGDVFVVPTGEAFKFVEIDPNGQFKAQVRSMATNEWTEFYMEGETAKIEGFLKRTKAVREM